MICHTVRIPYSYGETIRIRPIFDIHYGNYACDIKELKEFVSDKEAYYFGGGDWFDSITIKDKRYQKSMDSTKSDEIIDEQVEGLKDIISSINGRFLGLMTGNHEKKLAQSFGTHPIKRICKEYNIPFLGYSCFLRLMLHDNGSRVRTVKFYAHHGYGGGRTLGADLTRFSQPMMYYAADVYTFGHSHQKHWTPIERLDVNTNGKIIHKPKHLCVCGTFLRTLSDNTDSTYAEEAGFRPVSLGGLTINIKPTIHSYDIWVDR